MKVLLCGYHWTGCRVLEHLLARRDVTDVAVFSHPATSHVPDLCQLANERGIWLNTNDVSSQPLPFKPDVIASVYYRNLIRQNVIDVCGGRIFNLHPSLLPRHRGCSSVPWAMIDNDPVTGVTFHYIDKSIDTGNVILQAAVPIHAEDTQQALFKRCMRKGVEFWPAAFELVKASFTGVPQETGASYHRRGAPFGGKIDPAWDDAKIDRFIRAMTYPPYPPAEYAGMPVRSMEEYCHLRDGRGAARRAS
jgi:methionyl-tRNA formyltransferase